MSYLSLFNINWFFVLNLGSVFCFFDMNMSRLFVVMNFSNSFWCFNLCWRLVVNFSFCFF